MKFVNFQEHLFYRQPLVAASVAKTDQMKRQYSKKRYLRIFLLKHNDVSLMKVFFDHEIDYVLKL